MNIEFENFKQEIISKANLNMAEATGFYATYCPMCGKSDRKTGGYKFEEEQIGYNCFRGSCDASTVFTLGNPIPKKFRALMDTIGVDIPVKMRMVKSTFQKKMENLDTELYVKNHYKDIGIPEDFVKFNKAPEMYQKYWRNYLTQRRCDTNDMFIAIAGTYRGLCAIGMYYYDKVIMSQVITKEGNYIKLGGNTNVIYIPDRVVPNTVILVEGGMDAKCFPNTVATLQSRISPEQAYHLRGKDVIMLPDRGSNKFIDQFHQYGWKITIPMWNAKDLNSAVCMYGLVTTAEMIMDGIVTDRLSAKTKYKMWVNNERTD